MDAKAKSKAEFNWEDPLLPISSLSLASFSFRRSVFVAKASVGSWRSAVSS
jgi:hypothetical protein